MLLTEAEELELSDPAYRAELATWRRPEPAHDGIPEQAVTWTGAHSVTDLPLRDFTGHSATPALDAATPPRVERDALVLIGSDDDGPLGWLRTGRGLALVLLTLTAADVVTQPLGPVTDVPTTRMRLQRELGLLGHPQLLLRAGYGHGQPAAGRRDVEDTLAVATVA